MRAISDAMRERLASNTTLLAKATLTLADGAVRELSGDDLVAMSAEQATSGSGSFDVGAAVIGKLSIELNNHDERFSEYDFTGATIVAYVGADLGDTTEWLRLGTYTVDQPDSYAGTIAVEAMDNMSLFERLYSEVATAYPADLKTIVEDVCAKCGVVLQTPEFDNGGYVVPRRPGSENLTCLAVIGHAAQVCGSHAAVDERGRLVIGWYDTSEGRGSVGLGALSSLTVGTDDVVVTGIRVTAQNQVVVDSEGRETNGADGETAQSGPDGYVLKITDNPLVAYGQAAKVASMVAARVVGMRFRPFSCSSVSRPDLEAGDAVTLTDLRGRTYRSYATSVTLTVNGQSSVSCDAMSASRNSAAGSSALTEAVVKARDDLKREQTARELMAKTLGDQLADSSGLYETSVRQDDGSYVYYMHDKPELSSSRIVWKMTAEAVGVSTDGGKTYATALNASGDAVLQRIYAHGIDADYVRTGRLSDATGKNYWDLDTGEMHISAVSKVEVGARNLIRNSRTLMFSNYYLAGSAELEAVSVTGPLLRTGDCARFTVAEAGATLTLTGVARGGGSHAFSANVRSEQPGELSVAGARFATTAGWLRVEHVFEPDGDDLVLTFSKAGTYYVHEAKLETGTVATGWTPAPEDLDESIGAVGDKVTETNERITSSEAALEVLSNSISTLVTDGSGSSLMEQTANGWTFNVSGIQKSINEAIDGVTSVEGEVSEMGDLLEKTRDLLGDVSERTSYINLTQDASGAPCIELGKAESAFRLRITNTSMDFMQGQDRIAYLSNRQLYIQSSVVTDEMKIGDGAGYIWKRRENNHLGLRYVAS